MQFDDQEEFEKLVKKEKAEENPFFQNSQQIQKPSRVEESEPELLQPLPEEVFRRPKEIVKGVTLLGIGRVLEKAKAASDILVKGCVLSKLNAEELSLELQFAKGNKRPARLAKHVSKLMLKAFKYSADCQPDSRYEFRFDMYVIPQEQDLPSQSYSFRDQLLSRLGNGNTLSYQQLIIVYLVLAQFLGLRARRVDAIDLYAAKINKKVGLFDNLKLPKRRGKKLNPRLIEERKSFQSSVSKKEQFPQFVCEQQKFATWVQFYNGQCWVPYEPVTMDLGDDERILSFTRAKTKDLQSVLVLSTESVRPCAQRVLGRFVLKDQTVNYSQNWPSIELKRKRLGINDYLNKLLLMLDFRGPRQRVGKQRRQIWREEEAAKESKKQQMLPRSQPQMKASSVFCLVSTLRSNEILKKSAAPVGVKFKEEEIYLRRDVQTVRTRTGWNIEGRDVPIDAKPIKVIIEKRKNRQFFGRDQTVSFEYRRKADGSFLVNQYGNVYKYKYAQVPQDLLMIERSKFITTVCKKLKINFAEVVEGFEMDQLMWHPVKKEVLIYRADEERLRLAYDEFMAEKESKKKEKIYKELASIWRALFKQEKIRREVQERYDRTEQ